MISASSAPLWLEILRGTLIGTGGIILGMAAQVLLVYTQRFVRDHSPMAKHIMLISASYMCVVAVTMGTQIEILLEHRDSLSWRIPVLIVGYALGIHALAVVMKVVAARRATPRRRAADPG